MDSIHNQTFKLKSGRTLGFAEFGDPQGQPVFYFHGLPGSRLEAVLTTPHAIRHGIRVIAVDRPGYGLSEFEPGRRIADWPNHVTALADFLGLERFSILGVSGGGPYTAACAFKLSDRLVRVGIVCGMGPLDVPKASQGMKHFGRVFLFLNHKTPWLGRPLCAASARLFRRFPRHFFNVVAATSSPPDQVVLGEPLVRQGLEAALCEALRQGGRGVAWDLHLLNRTWGFALQDIGAEVHLWHGEMDLTVPAAFSRRVAAAIPNSHVNFFSQEGHFSLPVNRMDLVMKTLREGFEDG